jgi:hypothetical protein
MVIDASFAMIAQPLSDQPAEMPIMWHTQRSIDASTRLLFAVTRRRGVRC